MAHPDRHLREQPVLIIGAGITGLVLAQALKTKAIPFLIFERDPAANSRLQGWALTIHFCLPKLLSLLPESIAAQIDSTLIDPGARVITHDSVFLDLADCTAKWRFPLGPRSRKRVCRDKFRRLLLQGLTEELHWNKRVLSLDRLDVGVIARFDDGASYEGLLLVGADGANSMIRSLLYEPKTLSPRSIPLKFLGTSLLVDHNQIEALLDIDPVLFQGCHPRSSTWMWFSVMESPESNGSVSLPLANQIWKIQLCLSWPTQNGASDLLFTNEERVIAMRQKSMDFDPRLRAVLEDVLHSEKCHILNIRLSEWHLPSNLATAFQGYVTLAGDAAHTMAPHRGEGFNHAMVDAYQLVLAIERIYDRSVPETGSYIWKVREQVVASYEAEVRERGRNAVSKCHEAYLEVHNLNGLNVDSTPDSYRLW